MKSHNNCYFTTPDGLDYLIFYDRVYNDRSARLIKSVKSDDPVFKEFLRIFNSQNAHLIAPILSKKAGSDSCLGFSRPARMLNDSMPLHGNAPDMSSAELTNMLAVNKFIFDNRQHIFNIINNYYLHKKNKIIKKNSLLLDEIVGKLINLSLTSPNTNHNSRIDPKEVLSQYRSITDPAIKIAFINPLTNLVNLSIVSYSQRRQLSRELNKLATGHLSFVFSDPYANIPYDPQQIAFNRPDFNPSTLIKINENASGLYSHGFVILSDRGYCATAGGYSDTIDRATVFRTVKSAENYAAHFKNYSIFSVEIKVIKPVASMGVLNDIGASIAADYENNIIDSSIKYPSTSAKLKL